MTTTTLGQSTTYYVSNYYEVTDGVITKYYYAGSQRLAMRKDGVLTYILSDHLGSTSLVTDATGNAISDTKYKAWGEERYTSGSKQTPYSFTGQYGHQAEFGLLFYNSRYYDPSLSRFTSADSIVPAGVQGLDRYAYANNSPLKYTDPSGHAAIGDSDGIGCLSQDLACQLKNKPDRFYFLNNGGVIDKEHFDAGRGHGVQVAEAIADKDSSIKLIMLGEGEPYSYRVDLNGMSLDDPELLARYLEFQQTYEANQFETLPIHERGSGFSPEDIPSDLLGFIAGMKKMPLNTVIEILGGLKSTSNYVGNPAIEGTLNLPFAKNCLTSVCGTYDYQNSSPRFKVPLPITGRGQPFMYQLLNYPPPFNLLNGY